MIISNILKQSIFLLPNNLLSKMKTEIEIAEYRKVIEERLVKTESMDAMKYYQGVLRSLEWVVTGLDV
jgi:hypothetical protein